MVAISILIIGILFICAWILQVNQFVLLGSLIVLIVLWDVLGFYRSSLQKISPPPEVTSPKSEV